jgi:hypothetical protein
MVYDGNYSRYLLLHRENVSFPEKKCAHVAVTLAAHHKTIMYYSFFLSFEKIKKKKKKKKNRTPKLLLRWLLDSYYCTIVHKWHSFVTSRQQQKRRDFLNYHLSKNIFAIRCGLETRTYLATVLYHIFHFWSLATLDERTRRDAKIRVKLKSIRSEN